MKMRIALVITGVIICMIGLLGASTGGDFMRYITQLRSTNLADREIATRAILQNRQQLVGELQKIVTEFVGTDNRRGTAKSAVVLLGKLRSVESVPLLVENLTFEVFYKDIKRPQPVKDLFPCVGALAEIGLPSVEPVLTKVEETDEEKVIRCAAAVIKDVLGYELTIAYIEDRIKHQSDPARRQRLSHLQQYIDQQ